MKNNWVSEISEDEATGETAEIFSDIRITLGNGVVNLIWRHIATIEGALPWVWQAVKPLYISDVLKNEAGFLCENVKLICEIIKDYELLQAIQPIHDLIIRDQVTTESLYIK